MADIYGAAIGMTAEEADTAMRAGLADIDTGEIVPNDGTTPQRTGYEFFTNDAGLAMETPEGFQFTPSFTGHVAASEMDEFQQPDREPERFHTGQHFGYMLSSPLTGQTVESLRRSSKFYDDVHSAEVLEEGVLEKYGEPSHIEDFISQKTFYHAFKDGEKIQGLGRHEIDQVVTNCFRVASAPRLLKNSNATSFDYYSPGRNLDRYRSEDRVCDAGIFEITAPKELLTC